MMYRKQLQFITEIEIQIILTFNAFFYKVPFLFYMEAALFMLLFMIEV